MRRLKALIAVHAVTVLLGSGHAELELDTYWHFGQNQGKQNRRQRGSDTYWQKGHWQRHPVNERQRQSANGWQRQSVNNFQTLPVNSWQRKQANSLRREPESDWQRQLVKGWGSVHERCLNVSQPVRRGGEVRSHPRRTNYQHRGPSQYRTNDRGQKRGGRRRPGRGGRRQSRSGIWGKRARSLKNKLYMTFQPYLTHWNKKHKIERQDDR